MNHEHRIAKLEKENELLKQELATIKSILSLDKDWLPLSQAEDILGESYWVLRNNILNNPDIKKNIHYRKNGNRYLVNVEAWKILRGQRSEVRGQS
jgi:hypothetical protein